MTIYQVFYKQLIDKTVIVDSRVSASSRLYELGKKTMSYRRNQHVFHTLSLLKSSEQLNNKSQVLQNLALEGDNTSKNTLKPAECETQLPSALWSQWPLYSIWYKAILGTTIMVLLLMDKILHHQGWWLSHYSIYNHPRWCRILSINSSRYSIQEE